MFFLLLYIHFITTGLTKSDLMQLVNTDDMCEEILMICVRKYGSTYMFCDSVLIFDGLHCDP